MRTPPLSVVASWPMPNYVDPPSRGPVGKIVGSLLVVLVTLIMALRLYTRRFISKGFGLDDILIAVAFVPATAYAVLGIVGDTQYEWNRHIWDVRPELLELSLKAGLAELILFDLSTSLTKLSMLAMMYRITTASKNRALKTLVLVFASFISVNGCTFLLVTIFQCNPISDYWTLSFTPQRCINEAAHLLAAGTINTITDFVIVFLPIRTIMGLQLPRKQQLIVIGLFGAGVLACAAGITRTYFTWLMTSAPDHDTTWNAWSVWMSSGFELYVGIICASIPSIKPFFAIYLPQMIGTKIHSQTRSSDDTKPLKSPDSFKTFLQRMSSTSTNSRYSKGPLSPQSPTSVPSHKKFAAADLNKPLPVIHETERILSPRTIDSLMSGEALTREAESNLSPQTVDSTVSKESPTNPGRDLMDPQRAGVRFSNRSTTQFAPGTTSTEDRTTVFIMFQGEEERLGRAL